MVKAISCTLRTNDFKNVWNLSPLPKHSAAFIICTMINDSLGNKLIEHQKIEHHPKADFI